MKFFAGLFLGLLIMGVLETCIPGIGWHEAVVSKDACQKSLPRDQICVAHYVPDKPHDQD